MKHMIKIIRTIKSGLICRHCLNEVFGIKLKKEDLHYHMYAEPCDRCGKMTHLVIDVKLGGILRGINKQRKETM